MLTENVICCKVGGAVASWLVRSTPGQLVGYIGSCSWLRHYTLSLSTQVYKWVPTNLMLNLLIKKYIRRKYLYPDVGNKGLDSQTRIEVRCLVIFNTLCKVVLTVDETLVCDHSNESHQEVLFNVVLYITPPTVLLTSKSMDETPVCDHSNGSYRALLSCGAVYYTLKGCSYFFPASSALDLLVFRVIVGYWLLFHKCSNTA